MAATHDFILDQGSTWVRVLHCSNSAGTPVDFGVGASAKMQFRSVIGAADVLFEADCVVDSVAGTITATVLPIYTSAPAMDIFALKVGKVTENGVLRSGYISWYDLEVTFGDTTKIRVIEGKTCITPEVTLD